MESDRNKSESSTNPQRVQIDVFPPKKDYNASGTEYFFVIPQKQPMEGHARYCAGAESRGCGLPFTGVGVGGGVAAWASPPDPPV